MRWVERSAVGAALLFAMNAFADAPNYGKVETFQPGKKYNCVPTPDRKGWNCNESGKAASSRADTAPAPPASAPPAAESQPARTAAPSASLSTHQEQKAGDLPAYLTNAAAHGSPPAAQRQSPPPLAARESATQKAAPTAEASVPAQPEPAAAPKAAPPEQHEPAVTTASATATATPPAPAPPPVAATPPPAQKPPTMPVESSASTMPPAAPPPAAAATPAAQKTPAAAAVESPSATPPVSAKSAPSTPSAETGRSSPPAVPGANGDFLALPGDQFVVELAHADTTSELASRRESIRLPRGKVYELHLRQNGAERWLLLWGTFDSVDAARSARDEIATQGLAPGWPRRIAPLQAEARRASE